MIDRLEISNSKKNAREFLKLPTGSAEELSNRPKVTFLLRASTGQIYCCTNKGPRFLGLKRQFLYVFGKSP